MQENNVIMKIEGEKKQSTCLQVQTLNLKDQIWASNYILAIVFALLNPNLKQ